MRSPVVLIAAFDDWLANQLREMVAERGWLIREVRQRTAWVAAGREARPTVAVIQADLGADDSKALAAVGDLTQSHPDAAVVVVCDTKMAVDDRPAWAATVADLGGRMLLFPPLTRPVLEDLVGGLMEAVIARTTGVSGKPSVGDESAAALDLAAGLYEAGE